MKKTSLFFKLSLAFTLVFIVSMACYTGRCLSDTEEKTYAKLSQSLIDDLSNEETHLENIGIVNALFIADNRRIKDALIANDRQIAIKELQEIFKQFEKSTRIKDLKVHIHTAEVRSFVRNWKLDKFGDDLSGFRKAIIKVKETRQPIFAFEVGRIGLTLRSIVPIMDGERYLGSLEFIQAYDNVPKSLEKKGSNHLLLMDDSLINIATYLKSAPNVGSYKLSSKYFNHDFLSLAQRIDLDKLKEKGNLLSDEYLFTYKPIRDVNNELVGIHLLGMSAVQVSTAMENAKRSELLLIIISIISFVLILTTLIVLQRGRA